MPLRKNTPFITGTALLLAAAALAVPTAANAAWGWNPAPAATPTPKAAVPTPTPVATLAPSPTPTPAPAAASTPAPVAGGCTPLATTQAFSKFGDSAQYSLAPGGSFEGASAWKLTSGAKIVSGNENLGVAAGSKSLELPVGGTATSPEFCVDQTNPSFRFANKLSSLDGGYNAIVLYRDDAGKLTQAQFTSSAAGTYFNGATNWGASAISPLAVKIPFLGGGQTATVQLMFVGTTKSYGGWVGAKAYIDSVMVDPYRRG